MSAFDAITQSETLAGMLRDTPVIGNIYSDLETHVPSTGNEHTFRADVTHIIACYHDLAFHAAISGIISCESLSERTMTLGAALRTLTSVPSSLNLLLSLRDKDVSEVLEAVQLVRHVCTNISPICNNVR
jgi:hypothetical protein